MRRGLFQREPGMHTATACEERSPCQHRQHIDLPIAEWSIARRQKKRLSGIGTIRCVQGSLRDGENTGLEQIPGQVQRRRAPGHRHHHPSAVPRQGNDASGRPTRTRSGRPLPCCPRPTPGRRWHRLERYGAGRSVSIQRERSHRPTSTPLASVAASARDAASHCTVTCKSLKGGRCST